MFSALPQLIASFYSTPPPDDVLNKARLAAAAALLIPLGVGVLTRRHPWRNTALCGVLTAIVWGTLANLAYSYGGGDMKGMSQLVATVGWFCFGLGCGAIVTLVSAIFAARHFK